MRKLGMVMAALLFVAALAVAQSNYDLMDFNIMGAGARAHGMGGAFIGVADDATAISWNPAGIAQLEKVEASVVGIFNRKTLTYEFSSPAAPSQKDDESVNHIAPSFASFTFPLKVSERNMVMAVAYQRMIDMYYSYEYQGSDIGGDYNQTDKMTGGFDAISPAIGFQLSPQFSLGVAGNIFVNGYKEEFKERYPAYTQSYLDITSESKPSAFNISAGALASLNKINLGVMIRLPFKVKETFTETAKWDLTQASRIYEGTSVGSSSYEYKTKSSMPMMLGFGVAAKPTDKLTLAADYEMRNYEDTETEIQTPMGSFTEKNGWKNCNQIRVGLEYILTGPNAVFPVRMGFRTDPRVYKSYTGTFTNPDTSEQVVGKVFTAGFGLVMGSVMFDIAGEFGMATIVDLEEAGGAEKFEEKSLTIMSSLIFHF